METFRNLTFLLLFITTATSGGARIHKRRYLQDPKDDLNKVNFVDGKFIFPRPPASGGSPVCIIVQPPPGPPIPFPTFPPPPPGYPAETWPPLPAPPQPPANCVIIDKNSRPANKWRRLGRGGDKAVTGLKSALTARNHRRRTIQTRQKIRQLSRE